MPETGAEVWVVALLVAVLEAGPEVELAAGLEAGLEAGPEVELAAGLEAGPEVGLVAGLEVGFEVGVEGVSFRWRPWMSLVTLSRSSSMEAGGSLVRAIRSLSGALSISSRVG